jgi:hypothetical protein
LHNFVAANDNSQQASQASKAALDAQSQAHESHAKAVAKSALHALQLAGYIKLGSTIAYAASPAFRSFADSVLGIAKPAATATVNMVGLAPAVEKATATLAPFAKIAGAAEIVGLGAHFTTASAAALGLSASVRKVAGHEVVSGIKAIPAALATIAPVATTAGAAVLRFVTPLLTFAARIGGPIIAVVAAVKGLVALFELGKSKVDELSSALEKMGAGGAVSLEFLNGMTAAANKLKISTDSATESLKKFVEASMPRLGGSGLEVTLRDLDKAGNRIGKMGLDALRSANSTEEAFRNIAQVISRAAEQGERLAALKLAEAILPPEMMTRLRAMPDFMQRFVDTAEKAKTLKLVDEENVIRAAQLKNEIDEAYAILSEKWTLVLPDLTRLGLEFYAVWVKVVVKTAEFVEWVNKIPDRISEMIPDFDSVTAKLKEWSDWIDRIIGKLARMAEKVPIVGSAVAGTIRGLSGVGAEVGPQDTQQTEAMAAARRKLILLGADASAMTRAMTQAMEIEMRVLGDVSKAADDTAASWDRLVASIRRRIATQQAEAIAANQGIAAQSALRVQLELEAAAESRHIPITKARKQQIDELAKSAGAAAEALARMKVQTGISREFEGLRLGLTDQDIAIVEKLREIYPNISKAVTSAYAQQMRFNSALKSTRDTIVGFGSEIATGLVSGLRSGQRAAIALQQAFASAVGRATDKIVSEMSTALLQRMVTPLLASLFPQMITSSTAMATEIASAATTASTELVAAGASVSGAMIAGATEAAAILTTAKVVPFQQGGVIPGFQHGGVIPTPRGGMGVAVPILAHPGEEIVRADNPRHVNNYHTDNSVAPVISVNFTANGRMTSADIREHSMTIAKHVADQFAQNPTLRRSTRLR